VDLLIKRLLLDCGFKPAPTPPSARWALAGEIVGDLASRGLALSVTCMNGARGGFVLLVPSESERQVLRDMLVANGADMVDVRAERMQWRTPVLAVTVGVGALALFGWVLSNIGPFFQ
jgi:hypothetical protein